MSRNTGKGALVAVAFWAGASLGATDTAIAATESYSTLDFVYLSDFYDDDVACVNQSGSSTCYANMTATNFVYLDAFDTSLGTLTGVRLAYDMSVDGIYILRGDNLVSPYGKYETTLRTSLDQIYTSKPLGYEKVTGSLTNNGLTDQSYTTYSASLSRSNLLYLADDLDLFTSPYRTDRRFTFNMDLGVELETCSVFGFITAESCGATNRITDITGAVDVGPVILRNVFSVRTTYYYEAFPPPPPPSEVPLPGGLALALGGLAGLGAVGSRRGARAG